ncbi:MAG: arsenate reductase [Candidatus Azotimanducaceae bacterium]|jgi:arsenate reductase
MTSVTIYHNPGCSKSRQSLALLEQQGVKFNVIEYLQDPPNIATLQEICQQLDCVPMDIVRQGEEAFANCGLDQNASDSDVFYAINKTPILMQRPIVTCKNKARIGRPPESILEILPSL